MQYNMNVNLNQPTPRVRQLSEYDRQLEEYSARSIEGLRQDVMYDEFKFGKDVKHLADNWKHLRTLNIHFSFNKRFTLVYLQHAFGRMRMMLDENNQLRLVLDVYTLQRPDATDDSLIMKLISGCEANRAYDPTFHKRFKLDKVIEIDYDFGKEILAQIVNYYLESAKNYAPDLGGEFEYAIPVWIFSKNMPGVDYNLEAGVGRSGLVKMAAFISAYLSLKQLELAEPEFFVHLPNMYRFSEEREIADKDMEHIKQVSLMYTRGEYDKAFDYEYKEIVKDFEEVYNGWKNGVPFDKLDIQPPVVEKEPERPVEIVEPEYTVVKSLEEQIADGTELGEIIKHCYIDDKVAFEEVKRVFLSNPPFINSKEKMILPISEAYAPYYVEFFRHLDTNLSKDKMRVIDGRIKYQIELGYSLWWYYDDPVYRQLGVVIMYFGLIRLLRFFDCPELNYSHYEFEDKLPKIITNLDFLNRWIRWLMGENKDQKKKVYIVNDVVPVMIKAEDVKEEAEKEEIKKFAEKNSYLADVDVDKLIEQIADKKIEVPIGRMSYDSLPSTQIPTGLVVDNIQKSLEKHKKFKSFMEAPETEEEILLKDLVKDPIVMSNKPFLILAKRLFNKYKDEFIKENVFDIPRFVNKLVQSINTDVRLKPTTITLIYAYIIPWLQQTQNLKYVRDVFFTGFT